MFTGIVRELGSVESVERSDDGARLRIRAALASELAEGDSVAVLVVWVRSGSCSRSR